MTLKMTRLLTSTLALTAAIVTLFSTGGTAQQKVPFRGDTPIAPSGDSKAAASRSSGDLRHGGRPADSRRRARAGAVASVEPRVPPDGAMLVTERDGRLRLIRNGTLDPKPVEGVPTIRRAGLLGPDGRRPPSSVRDQQVRLSLIRQADQRESRRPPPSRAATGTARH